MSDHRTEVTAFPIVHPGGEGVQFYGMSLRDYFASAFASAQATTTSADTGFINPGYIDPRYEGLTVAQNIAKTSYALADAMLAERAK